MNKRSIDHGEKATPKERPILFSGAMVRALLDGTKTQTRRVMKPQPKRVSDTTILEWRGGLYQPERLPANSNMLAHCPHGKPGDRLWVREAWAQRGTWRLPAWPEADADDAYWAGTEEVIYTADVEKPATGWRGRPSIHMPRWASRILLEIISVRVERLNDISEDDCWAEGIDAVDGALDDMAIINLAKSMSRSFEDAAPTYAALWESINGADSWEVNPWVWAITFKRVTP